MASQFLGIDYGRARVGLAVAGDDTAPERLKTLSNDTSLMKRLQAIMSEHGITQVVVGLPRGVEGEETAQTALVREFVRTLQAATDAPVALQDEFATSEMAEERLGVQGRPTPEQSALIDQEAAVIILEDYLAG